MIERTIVILVNTFNLPRSSLPLRTLQKMNISIERERERKDQNLRDDSSKLTILDPTSSEDMP